MKKKQCKYSSKHQTHAHTKILTFSIIYLHNKWSESTVFGNQYWNINALTGFLAEFKWIRCLLIWVQRFFFHLLIGCAIIFLLLFLLFKSDDSFQAAILKVIKWATMKFEIFNLWNIVEDDRIGLSHHCLNRKWYNQRKHERKRFALAKIQYKCDNSICVVIHHF